MTDKECSDYLNEQLKEYYPYSDKELGIDIKDYDFNKGESQKYHDKKNYLTLQKFYLTNMKPIKDDYFFLESHYHYIEKYDYSFIISPSIRYLLLNESLPETDINDPYFVLLDYKKRIKIHKLIELLDETENFDLKNKILDKINELQTGNYIITEWEYRKLLISNLIRKK
jgi:hypothetical protein